MDHMHMDSGLGMDYNYAFARAYWYILAGAVGAFTAVRVINFYGEKLRYVRDKSSQEQERVASDAMC